MENSASFWFIFYGHNPVVYSVKNLFSRNKIPSTIPVYTTLKSAKTDRKKPAFRIRILA